MHPSVWDEPCADFTQSIGNKKSAHEEKIDANVCYGSQADIVATPK